jgi:hypothetical protein
MNYPLANIIKAPMKIIEEVIERAKKAVTATGQKIRRYSWGLH